jgi:hypothetical protein
LYIRHPWESGQDNSPIWDQSLKRITLKPDDIPQYKRVDTEIVGSEDRPSNAEYDRYAYLVRVGYDNEYSEERIRMDCPFLIKDVLLNTIAVKANRDLAEIALVLDKDPTPFTQWADLTARSLNSKLWNEESSIYFDFDMTTDSIIESHVAAGFTPLFAGVPSKERGVKKSILKLTQECGIYEYYDPDSGSGHGADQFSWTAALLLDLLYEETTIV